MILYNEKGGWSTVAYRADLLAFNGIFNPLRTPDDSGDCCAEGYGFELVNTGGGCMAWQYTLTDGSYLLLTDSEGCDVPAPNDTESPMLGRYSAEGDPIALVEDFAELPKNGSH